MTSRTTALKAIAVFDEYPTHVVVLTQRAKSAAELFRLNLTEDLAGRFRSLAHKVGSELQKRTVVDYDVGRLLAPYEMVAIKGSPSALFQSIRSQLSNPIDLALFDPASKAADAIRAYFVCIQRPDRDVYFFSALTPRARVAKGGRLAVTYSNGVYDRLKREVLVFDPKFDGVIADDWIFTTKLTTAERLFDLLDEIQQVATEAFDSVTTNLAIKNLDEFRAVAVTDINMMRKLSSIADKIEKDPDYLDAMAMAKITAFLKDRPHIEIDIEGSGKDAQFVFHNDPQRRWRILHLLDDDYLHSPLTDLDYEANSKNLIGGT